jgi:futalosine hydrolase
MNILLVSATLFEVRPFADRLSPAGTEGEHLFRHMLNGHSVDLLLPGVGMLVTAYHMGRRLSQINYDLAINAGIAGSFRPELPIGEVVEVTEDCVTELGAEGDSGMVSFFELGLMDPDAYPYRNGRLVNVLPVRARTLEQVRKVTGSTVNTIRGTAEGVRRVKAQSAADIETMEGASFLYSCLSARIPSIQIRSVSNFVEERDKAKWDVPLALKNLNRTLEEVVMELVTS